MTQEKLKQFLDACFDAKRLIENISRTCRTV